MIFTILGLFLYILGIFFEIYFDRNIMYLDQFTLRYQHTKSCILELEFSMKFWRKKGKLESWNNGLKWRTFFSLFFSSTMVLLQLFIFEKIKIYEVMRRGVNVLLGNKITRFIWTVVFNSYYIKRFRSWKFLISICRFLLLYYWYIYQIIFYYYYFFSLVNAT